MNDVIHETPWDAAAFGLHTAEILTYSAEALEQAGRTPGHYTIKVDPLADKRLLHEHGFYYCDTLIEPHCTAARLVSHAHPEATISKQIAWEKLLPICHGAFSHGRFHRDFNLDRTAADKRYDNWLHQSYEQQRVYGLFRQDELAGFIAYDANSLILHAVAPSQRGKGFARYWWSAVITELFASGHQEVKSSISAANAAALNLYASLGFGFRKPVDIYHRLIV